MVYEIRLENKGNPLKYKLTPILNVGEAITGKQPLSILGSKEQIDNCFIVYKDQIIGGVYASEVVGVAKSVEELPGKTYQCALIAGKRLSEIFNCPLVNLSSRAKEGKLVATVNQKIP